MSTIRVGNVHFETTGTNRIDYPIANTIHFNTANASFRVNGSERLRVSNTGVDITGALNVSGNTTIGPLTVTNNLINITGALNVSGNVNAGTLLVNGEPFAGGATMFGMNIGNSAANTFNIAHNLNKFYTMVNVRENATGYHVYPDIRYTTPNHVEIQFVDNPTANQYLVLVLGG